ncbi:C2H2 finger domain transcription factor crzA-like [Belonocnema kinseyi]|uniref:C2H2 finger domain transcription factor crzA-like n=1 Tax=Belonocnema kinseyi TaxID=2817044 RepID=UPI00143D05BE|nr:C2H2 finger domain transcription factor crzA-like [Belonocnema kinseyi]
MSEMSSEEQHHQQKFVDDGSNSEHHCKDHSVPFESEKSLEMHLRCHNGNLLSQWASQAQQEESNNNNSKAGNHNSSNHMVVKRESVTAPADSSEPTSRPPSEGTASSSRRQHTPTSQGFQDFPTPMFNENNYYMQNEQQNYVLPHNYSPTREESQSGDVNFSRYHPYQHQQRFPQGDRANSVSSSSPRSPLQCDKCGAVYEDPHQLAEHRSHHTSSNTYPSQPQYQQIGTSQHQIQRHQQSQMHNSPPHTIRQHAGFDFSGGSIIKTELKPESEEQTAEIFDLDSQKVQTHRYEEDLIKVQHQQQQHQMQHHAMQHQQRTAPHSVSSMLSSWPSPQLHQEYHPGISPVAPMNSPSPIPDQSQFRRAQQMPLEPSRHGASPIITSTQSLPTHQLPPLQHSTDPLDDQSWKSNKARRPKTYNCTSCNKWFTSSGHLKRHYNTTLHKNAVKVSNQPDPADMPISVHHHPGRDAIRNREGPRSPELSSSGSPPNLMAGPSNEATRGLLHTSITTTSLSNNSHKSSEIQETLSQQQVVSAARMSNFVPLNCPPHSPMGHHQHQMGAPSPQLAQRNHRMNSPQMGVHHHMNSPITYSQHPPTHLNSPSPMGQHQHMSSPSPMMGGVSPMPTPPLPMGDTTMPHQPYPNGFHPHVTTTTSIQGLMDITSLATTGNDLQPSMQFTQEILPGFGTFNNTQMSLPSFNNFGMNSGYNIVGHNPSQVINVGGLSPEENIPPPDRNFNTPLPNYDTYRHAPPKYESLTNMDVLHCTAPYGNIYDKYQDYIQQEPPLYYDIPRSRFQVEANNHYLDEEPPTAKLNPNIKRKKNAKLKGAVTKEQQVTSTNSDLPYISENDRHKCHDCNKYFSKSCYLTQHNTSFHAGDKPFKCNQCGKRFPHKTIHAEHLQKHAGEKPYKCEICPKQFNHKTDLRRHMCLHTGKKPYACDICHKGFIRKDHMMKHVETHRKKQSSTDQLNVHLRA